MAPRAGDEPLLLVVEDGPDLSQSICAGLGSEVRVAAAFGNAQGLEQAIALRPDFILADGMTPGAGGEALVRELRCRGEFDDVPILVLGARADAEQRIRLLRGGAQDYLVKPFSMVELRVRMENHLSRARAMRSLRRSEEYWREMFSQASDGIVIGDAQCGIVEANAAACILFGRERDALVGTGPRDWLVTRSADAGDKPLAELREGRPVTGEWVLRRPDGGQAHVDVTARHLSDGRCLAFFRDATSRREREQAVEAVNDELERRVAMRTSELRRMTADLERVESRERRQIARDLHDDLGQVLAAARIRLAALCKDARDDVRRPALEVAELIEQANRATRSLAAQLAPAVLYELGLYPALEWLADELALHFGMRVTVDDDGEPKPLPQEARSILYRAARELLINVAKHAGVDRASVSLSRQDRVVHVRVSDGGVGFSVGPAQGGSGMGLMSVRERLSHIGGSFEIRSIPGDGTEAMLTAPLDLDAAG